MTARAVAAAALALALAGCDLGGDGEEGAPARPDGTATAEAGQARCTNEEGGFSVAYPEEWHTNEGSAVAACTYFDPEPIRLEPATEAIGIAIRIAHEPVAYDRAAAESPGRTDVSREQLTVAGRDAVRLTYTATGRGLLPEGTRAVAYLVPAEEGTIVATTEDVAGVDFDRARDVLAAMIDSLELSGR